MTRLGAATGLAARTPCRTVGEHQESDAVRAACRRGGEGVSPLGVGRSNAPRAAPERRGGHNRPPGIQAVRRSSRSKVLPFAPSPRSRGTRRTSSDGDEPHRAVTGHGRSRSDRAMPGRVPEETDRCESGGFATGGVQAPPHRCTDTQPPKEKPSQVPLFRAGMPFPASRYSRGSQLGRRFVPRRERGLICGVFFSLRTGRELRNCTHDGRATDRFKAGSEFSVTRAPGGAERGYA